MAEQNETHTSPAPEALPSPDDVTALRAEMRELSETVTDMSRRLRQMQRALTIINRQTRAAPADVQAIHQLLTRFPPRSALPAVGGWAMDPSSLLWMVDHAVRQRTRLVVECGSGTSTVWLAKALQETGGRLVSLEHSEEFLAITQEHLDAQGVADVVELRHAPLVPTATERGEFTWYDVDTTGLDGIELLLVDGPPGATGPLARYPAMPTFANLLADGAVVVVDDVSRKDERDMVEHWLAEQPSLRRLQQLGLNTEVLGSGEPVRRSRPAQP